MSVWKRVRKRLRGVLGFGVLGAVGFHIIGWLIVGAEALAEGAWPSLDEIVRMTRFTIAVGGTVGVLSAGAIALGAGSSRTITRGRAFLIGLPLGVGGGLVMSAGLPLGDVLFVCGSVGIATGLVGTAAVALADRAVGPGEAAAEAVESGATPSPEADRSLADS